MNVCMLSPEYPPHVVGGLGAHVAHLAPLLAGKGIHVHVVTTGQDGGDMEERDGQLEVSRVDGGQLPEDFLEQTAILNDYVYGRAAAIVGSRPGEWLLHAHDWLVGDAALRLQRDYGLPLLATIHATEYGRNQGIHTELQSRIHNEEHRLVNDADAMIACSNFMAQQIADIFSVPGSKVNVIANGVDVSRLIDTDFDHDAFRRDYAQPDERIVLQVGRLVGEKGVFVLLTAVPKVLEVFPNVRFVIVGSGPALAAAREAAAGQPWSDHVRFTGFAPDEVRNRLYQVADLAVFPSTYEPFGIVALEAMALGVPVVTSNAGGLAEVVDPEETGVVVEAGSPDSLAWGIVHTLEQPDIARCRAERAQGKANTEFTWDKIADETIRVYERLAAR